MADQFVEISLTIIGICHNHVVADAGAYMNLAHFGYGAKLSEQLSMRLVIDTELWTDLGVEATFVHAGSAGGFVVAFEAVHVGSWGGEIMDDAGEAWPLGELTRFGEDGSLGTPGDAATLMNGDSAEITLAITAAVCRDAETDRFKGSDLALSGVEGVNLVFERQGVDRVHLFGSERWRRGILDDVAVSETLGKTLGRDGVIVVIEEVEHARESRFISGNLCEGRQFEIVSGLDIAGITKTANRAGVAAAFEGFG